MINILKAHNLLLLPIWSDLYAQFTEAQLKLMPVVDINKLYSFLVIKFIIMIFLRQIRKKWQKKFIFIKTFIKQKI